MPSMAMEVPFDVVVVGSLNQDISVVASHLPRPGETVLATDHFTGPGGKGANQAVAVARLGAAVAMVGMVGDDDEGKSLLRNLEDNGVDVRAVGVDRAPTGLALITIGPDGENTIVGSSGANMGLTPAHVRTHRDLIASATVVIAQLEVPPETVLEAARATAGTFCLNPAPAMTVSPELLAEVDVLIPNRTELGHLAGTEEPLTPDAVAEALQQLEFDRAVAVTLGKDGALLSEGGTLTSFAAHSVEAVDATGAGDAFCGALAFGISRGEPLREAVSLAVSAGAVAVTKMGAQEVLPTLSEVRAISDR